MASKSKTEMTAIPAWLLLGPIPISEGPPGNWLQHGYPCENDFAPGPKQSFDGMKWFGWKATDTGLVDLLDPALPLERRHWCLVYAFTYVYAPNAQKAFLRLGSDDGVAVWVNGQEVWRKDVQRGLAADEDSIPINLRKGWNALLLKVSQCIAGWAFQARLAPSGRASRLKGLRFTLRRPSARAFPGLKVRQNGLVPAEPSPRLTYDAAEGKPVVQVSLRVFNDDRNRSGKVRALLASGDGRAAVEQAVAALPSFTTKEITVRLPLGKAVRILAGNRGAPLLTVSAKNRKITSRLGKDTPARLFLGIMSGIPIDVPDPDARDGSVVVPPLFRGQPALVEVYAREPQAFTREVRWPAFESEEFSGEETAKGRIPVRIRPPRGVPSTAGRVIFGKKSLRASIDELAFLAMVHQVDLRKHRDVAGQGLVAIEQGDFRGAGRALKRFLEELRVGLPDRKREMVSLVGHAHIDMNWLWTYQETVQCCQDTFRQVLRFMKEFPDFCFSQSQASSYQGIEEFDPELFEEIRQRVKEGRWELLGGGVDEGDTNMSSGEAICRTFLIGQRYFRDRFGKIARVGWLPDNFGHVAQLPQLLRLAGMEFFYGHRCQPKQGPYLWEGVDGSRVLNFATPTYNGEVTPDIKDAPRGYNPQHKRTIWVYGVGDHGGGPTRRDITRAKAYDELPGFPSMEFTTAEKFYRSIKRHARDYPVFKGELQYVFEGCYTSISRIKEGNRRGENTLYTGELYAALGSLRRHPYPKGLIKDAWYTLAFNQFHDILCGSATHESNRESIGNYDRAVAQADQVLFDSLRRWAEEVNTSPPRGVQKEGAQPVVIFNPLPVARTDVVEAEIFSHQPPPTAKIPHWGYFVPQPLEAVDVGQGRYASIRLVDHEGNEVPAQITNGKLYPNGYRLRVRFVAEDVPAGGYRTYFAYPAEPGAGADKDLRVRGTRIETPHLIVEVDRKTGHLVRVYDRSRKREVIPRGEAANLLKIYMEAPHGMSAWYLGPVTAIHALDQAESVKVVELGPVRAVVQVERSWNRSQFVQRIIVYRDLPRVDFELDVRWFELGGPDKDSPTLRAAFPLAVKDGKFMCDTPFAAVERPTTGREVPAQKWIDLSGRHGGAALLNDSKYGHRCDEDTMETTLLRASYDPDLYPEQGPHLIRYSLLPHRGSWIQGGVAQAGLGFNVPLQAMETAAHAGPLPATGSLFEVTPSNVYLSAIKKPEKGTGLIIRLYEGHGKRGVTEAVVRLPEKIRSALRVNILEDRIPGKEVSTPVVRGGKVRIRLHPHEVVTLQLKF